MPKINFKWLNLMKKSQNKNFKLKKPNRCYLNLARLNNKPFSKLNNNPTKQQKKPWQLHQPNLKLNMLIG
jgi:hypothetical protein